MTPGILQFDVKPGEKCPICEKVFVEGDGVFRGTDKTTGKEVHLHAECAFKAVRDGNGHFTQKIGEA